MRAQIKFEVRSKALLPYNYQHALTALIYRGLGVESAKLATFLHDIGFRREKKTFKFFTFSPLSFANYKTTKEGIIVFPGTASFTVSSPLPEFTDYLASGLWAKRSFKIFALPVIISEIIPLPLRRFTEEEIFTLKSPLVLAVKSQEKTTPIYLTYLEDKALYREKLLNNLKNKYLVYYGREPRIDYFDFAFDEKHFQNKLPTRLITYKDQKIRGLCAPFKIKANPELISLGYYAGFGEKNSMGFGFVE
ncbi:CRISPR-associated protein Cas6 [Carboxydothermus pertinax]|uniref:CRISPR-associated endoribonuclease n=1 Tax=Carboxydothermus pertinax TaxID=870242 RepID=A0A1L8CVZ1_9THEO|nr:CRISPR-associated protein Cas6 [Carboxydothermus pertinax]